MRPEFGDCRRPRGTRAIRASVVVLCPTRLTPGRHGMTGFMSNLATSHARTNPCVSVHAVQFSRIVVRRWRPFDHLPLSRPPRGGSCADPWRASYAGVSVWRSRKWCLMRFVPLRGVASSAACES
jgi:hypothetical protein